MDLLKELDWRRLRVNHIRGKIRVAIQQGRKDHLEHWSRLLPGCERQLKAWTIVVGGFLNQTYLWN